MWKQAFSQRETYDVAYSLAEDDFKISFYELTCIDWMVKKLKISSKSNILDVGCGLGKVLTFICYLKGCYGVGVDISIKGLKKAYNYAKKLNVKDKCDFIVADIRFLPFRKNIFTSIICNHVLEHVEDDFKVMEEMISSLNFNGGIYIASPNTYKRSLPLIQLDYRIGDKYHGHLRHYKAETLASYLSKLGAKVLEVAYYDNLLRKVVFNLPKIGGFEPYPLNSISLRKRFSEALWFVLERIEEKIKHIPTGLNLYIVAVKEQNLS